MINSSARRLTALVISAAVLIAACGGGTSATPSTEPLTGEISISGSSTVQPISQGVAEAFNEIHPDVAIAVDGPGTGDGFQLFCAGDTDISDASRAIRDAEKELCTGGGVEFIELKVAIDGLSILTSVNNTLVTCLSFADLYALTGPESEGFDNWADAQALATRSARRRRCPMRRSRSPDPVRNPARTTTTSSPSSPTGQRSAPSRTRRARTTTRTRTTT